MTKLQIGDKAPNFLLLDSLGKERKLSDYDKLILYFYPKDNTPGCTAQACSLRDEYKPLKDLGYEIVGVSGDNENSHKRFIDKHNLPFTLLVDTDNKLCESYGVFGEKKFMGKTFLGIIRTTFIIENGVITHIVDKVKTKEHGAQLLQIINKD